MFADKYRMLVQERQAIINKMHGSKMNEYLFDVEPLPDRYHHSTTENRLPKKHTVQDTVNLTNMNYTHDTPIRDISPDLGQDLQTNFADKKPFVNVYSSLELPTINRTINHEQLRSLNVST
jgi:hypothetical protein